MMTETMESNPVRALALVATLTLSLGSLWAQSPGAPLLAAGSGWAAPSGDARPEIGEGTARVRLADGRLMVTGGRDSRSDRLRSTRFFDPVAKTWTAGSPMLFARAGHASALLDDGRVLVVGGGTGGSANPEIYDPVGDRWTIAGSMADDAGTTFSPLGYVTFFDGRLERLDDGRVLAIGTNGGGMQIYDPARDRWSVPPRAE